MSLPRRLLPDQLHAVSRRTQLQARFLTPTPQATALISYSLILSASRHPTAEVYAFCALSNHYHCALCDRCGGADSELPAFFRDLNQLIARGLNAQHARRGALWAPGSYRNVEVHGQASRDDQLLYIWTQPVEAGLVEHPEEWPGVIWLPEDIGTTVTATRPDGAFFGGPRPTEPLPSALLRAEINAEQRQIRRATRPKRGKRGRTKRRQRQLDRERANRKAKSDAGPAAPAPAAPAAPASKSRSTLPDQVSYTIPVPEGFESAEAARIYFRRLLDARLAEIWAERAALGLGYLGRDALLAQDPFSQPPPSPPDFERNPRVACLDSKEQRLALYDDLVAWRGDHASGVELLMLPAPWRARFPKGAHQRARQLRLLLAAYRAAPP